ncbi:hypothetical protein SteCoe_8896 [Stentor coeruleus]|uniref:Tyrosine-protein kinase ephrin type A/B receptor-like domain-containing protein n=1 Tax=Stentor coeruleus TaxID=5963 RepID=A0A1R2CJD8_9CILI|nr:hypothetical protein SteCoe_8896 [Stentor coeruleus]
MFYLIFLFLVSGEINLSYIPPNKTPPKPRSGHIQCSLPSSNSLIIFGGAYSEILYNDLWLFTINTLSWSEINPTTSELPSERSYLGGFISSTTEKFYIFGGKSDLGPKNDLWEFDLKNNIWSFILTKNPPSARFAYSYTSFVKDGIEYFAIYSGKKKNMLDIDLILLNMNTLEWERKLSNGDVPSAYSFENMGYYNGCIYFTGMNLMINTFKYDIDGEMWKNISNQMETHNFRSYGSGTVFDGFFYLFFGYDYSTDDDFDSIIRLDLASDFNLWEDFLVIPELKSESFSLSPFSENIYIFGGLNYRGFTIENRLAKINLKTKDYTIISSLFLYPEGRYSGTMSVINSKLYLFGGKNSKQLFNDMWVYHTDSQHWESLTISGEVPSPRYQHSICTEGDAMILWGGVDSGGLKNDLFIYNTLTNYWSQINPLSLIMPRAAKAACIVSKIPKIYIYGGITNSGHSGELWEFDMSSLNYKLISKYKQLAYHTCEIIENIIYVIFGSESSGFTLGCVYEFNITSQVWEKSEDLNVDSEVTSLSLHAFLYDTVLSIGGVFMQVTAKNEVMIIKNSTLSIDTIPNYVHSSNYIHYKSSIYSFGGGSNFDDFIVPSLASSLFFSIDLNDICQNNNCTVLCSSGTYKINNTCNECSPGYYAEGKGNNKCFPCPSGTYNRNYGASSSRQCYPCPIGSFSSIPGSARCLDCPHSQLCPTGSKDPAIQLLRESTKSVQPSIYTPNTGGNSLTYQIITGIILCSALFLFISIEKTRKYLNIVDIYKDKHNYNLYQPMSLQKTFYGGFFSLIFLSLVIILIGSTLIEYDQNNIIENKGFVPLLVLETKVPKFSATLLYIYTSFEGYGDSCSHNNTCNSNINIEYSNIKGSSISYTCELSQLKTCKISIKCIDCTIYIGAQVIISLSERLSYASGIEINITSDSSLPDSISSLVYSLYPLPNYVFIGSKASEFFFTIISSYFTSESSRWDSEKTGYHISSEFPPISGSQFLNSELAIASGIKAQINLDINSSGLLTQRLLKQTWLYFLSGMLGSIFGIQGAVGAVMRICEQYCVSILNKKNMKRNFINIKRKRKLLSLGIDCLDSENNVQNTSNSIEKDIFFKGHVRYNQVAQGKKELLDIEDLD